MADNDTELGRDSLPPQVGPARFERLSSWLAVIANLGVLIGLILVILQLTQNERMIRAQTRHDISDEIVTLLLETAANERLNSIYYRGNAGEPLDPEDAHAYNMRLNALLRYWEDVDYQHRMGLYDEDEFDKHRLAWQNMMSSSARAVSYWCEMRPFYSTEFAKEMDSLLAPDACKVEPAIEK